MSAEHFPRKVVVASIVKSRYPQNRRPDSWDKRVAGADVVRTSDGSELILQSDGGQAPPQIGWVIMLTSGNHERGYEWTLYGLPRSQHSAQPAVVQ